jgi:hypothetical protein
LAENFLRRQQAQATLLAFIRFFSFFFNICSLDCGGREQARQLGLLSFANSNDVKQRTTKLTVHCFSFLLHVGFVAHALPIENSAFAAPTPG